MKLKTLTMAALLTLACSAAQAEKHWLTITGFYDNLTQTDRPDSVIYGSFEGTDLDNNGILQGGEVEYLSINGRYFGNDCTWPWACQLQLSYSKSDGALDIEAYMYQGDPEHIVYSTYDFSTASGYAISRVTPAQSYTRWFGWRDYTTFAVSPVPEPASAGMLLAGLAATAFAARRRS